MELNTILTKAIEMCIIHFFMGEVSYELKRRV